MRVKSLGNNKTELHLNDGTIIFFSYETPVAAYLSTDKFIKTGTKYSATTSRHVRQWLDGADAETVTQGYLDKLAGDYYDKSL